jgi:hypothetical protein
MVWIYTKYLLDVITYNQPTDRPNQTNLNHAKQHNPPNQPKQATILRPIYHPLIQLLCPINDLPTHPPIYHLPTYLRNLISTNLTYLSDSLYICSIPISVCLLTKSIARSTKRIYLFSFLSLSLSLCTYVYIPTCLCIMGKATTNSLHRLNINVAFSNQ